MNRLPLPSGWVWGGMGLILAIPITATLRVIATAPHRGAPSAASDPPALLSWYVIQLMLFEDSFVRLLGLGYVLRFAALAREVVFLNGAALYLLLSQARIFVAAASSPVWRPCGMLRRERT